VRQKIGFIGAGNMAKALVKGLLESKRYDKEDIIASDKDQNILNNMIEEFAIIKCSSNIDLVENSNIVLLAIKPQNMIDVLEEIKQVVGNQHLLISIAAGIPLKVLQERLGNQSPLIRVMPNTPALVQKGMSALACGIMATSKHMALATQIFKSVGETVEIDENLMDAVTALSGSGPGYIFRIMECMVAAGQNLGLEQKIALDLVVQTFLGSAQLAKDSDKTLYQLREMVTSPGGTTAAGLSTLNKLGLKEILDKTLDASCKKSIELGQKL